MRGVTAAERRAERLQSVTYLGLVADDVALAALHYPDMSARERHAVGSLTELLDEMTSPRPSGSLFPRRRSMSDPSAILEQTALARVAAEEHHPVNLDELRAAVVSVRDGTADERSLRLVGLMAEVLSQVTLTLAQDLSSEKDESEWTHPASAFYRN